MAQSSFAQTPPKQPSEQQSCAVVHATPLARQASRHWMSPACPVTGSHSPLQQARDVVQLAPGTRQTPADPAASTKLTAGAPAHRPPVHVPEQQSKPCWQGPSAALQVRVVTLLVAVGALPPQAWAVHAPTQHWRRRWEGTPTVRHDDPSTKSDARLPSASRPPSCASPASSRVAVPNASPVPHPATAPGRARARARAPESRAVAARRPTKNRRYGFEFCIYGHSGVWGSHDSIDPASAHACTAHVPAAHSACARHACTRVPPPPPQSPRQLADAGKEEKS